MIEARNADGDRGFAAIAPAWPLDGDFDDSPPEAPPSGQTSSLARRGTWLLLLLVALAAQLGIVRPAAAAARGDTGVGVVERGTLPVVAARRDPPTAARPSDAPIDPPDADVDGPRRASLCAAQTDVVDPVAVVAAWGTHRRRGGASPRGPPSFEH